MRSLNCPIYRGSRARRHYCPRSEHKRLSRYASPPGVRRPETRVITHLMLIMPIAGGSYARPLRHPPRPIPLNYIGPRPTPSPFNRLLSFDEIETVPDGCITGQLRCGSLNKRTGPATKWKARRSNATECARRRAVSRCASIISRRKVAACTFDCLHPERPVPRHRSLIVPG